MKQEKNQVKNLKKARTHAKKSNYFCKFVWKKEKAKFFQKNISTEIFARLSTTNMVLIILSTGC
ncbi:hypothetical protein LCB40_04140 [Lactobacillus corticis]|uniref:Uncharacterized protein n=1 Tax=Lactobacillus corticis TaxID=2201249 RepID=A0A916VIX4_9LACO|nr:hypothetical protein LCB40_04140 [Lactobacillus corticis]